ncbi:Ion transport protein, partial [Halocaridina rubra]
ITMIVEGFVLCFYLFRLAHISVFTPLTRFWSDTKHVLIFCMIGLTLLDMIMYIGLLESGYYCVRWSRVLRPLFAINFPEMKQIRRSFRNLRKTFPDLINVLCLFFFCLSIFSLMGFKLFGGRGLQLVDGRPYFNTYWDSIFDLYVLVTTANNPDIMMPAYDASPYYVIFFVIFLVICFFIYMNIILAVIYNNYRKHLKNEVKKTVYSKRQQLSKAFDILAVNTPSKPPFQVLYSHPQDDDNSQTDRKSSVDITSILSGEGNEHLGVGGCLTAVKKSLVNKGLKWRLESFFLLGRLTQEVLP